MRTQQEIVDRINALEKIHPSELHKPNPQTLELIWCLDFEHAKPFLHKDITEMVWEKSTKPAKEYIKDFIETGWFLANNGAYALSHSDFSRMKSLLWLDNKEELLKKLDEPFHFFGKPFLYLLSNEYGINWRELDDNRWRSTHADIGLTADQAIALIFG
jgi:hypothetical protein